MDRHGGERVALRIEHLAAQYGESVRIDHAVGDSGLDLLEQEIVALGKRSLLGGYQRWRDSCGIGRQLVTQLSRFPGA